jgi:protein phosphatase
VRILAQRPVFLVAERGEDGPAGSEPAAVEPRPAALLRVFADLAGRDVSVAEAVSSVHSAVAAHAGGRTGSGALLAGVILVAGPSGPAWLAIEPDGAEGAGVHRLNGDRLQPLSPSGSLPPGGAQVPGCSLVPVVHGDRLLVGSAGLWRTLGDEALRAGLVMGGTPQSTADALVATASERGELRAAAIVLDAEIAAPRPAGPAPVSAAVVRGAAAAAGGEGAAAAAAETTDATVSIGRPDATVDIGRWPDTRRIPGRGSSPQP